MGDTLCSVSQKEEKCNRAGIEKEDENGSKEENFSVFIFE